MDGTTVLAIDPGNTESAFVIYDGEKPLLFGKWANATLLREINVGRSFEGVNRCAIEMVGHYGTGMPVGKEIFHTVVWIGRYYEAWFENRAGGEKFALHEPDLILRKAVVTHHCGSAMAKDGNVRQSLIDRWGGESLAIGGKKCPKCKGKGWTGRDHEPCAEWLHPPGPLHGVSCDVWQALALAVYFFEVTRVVGSQNVLGAA